MLEERVKYLKAFVSYLFKRFAENRCSSIAAELTVTSLLALVPLTAVVFALLAFIPSFQELGDQLQTLLFKYFVPGTGETVQHYINEFVGKAKGLSGVGTLMLLVTALLMMRTIDTSFNKIWHVESSQSMVRTLLVYWAVLTLGPILMGSSLLITSYIKSLPIISDVVSEHGFGVTLWLPFFMASLAFCVMYYVIPNAKIALKNAVISGVVTAMLFEVAKYFFAVFVTSFSTYQLIFGALAAVPLFLIWIYLSWSIVLLGAEFCHALGAFEIVESCNREHPFIQLVALLLNLARHQQCGTYLNDHGHQAEKGESSVVSDIYWLEKLVEAGLVAKVSEGNYCLVKRADKIDYATIFDLSGRQLPGQTDINSCQLPEETRRSLTRLTGSLHSALNDHLVVSDYQEK